MVFEQGVYALALLAAVLLTIFGGVTDRLIPLYAVGAFLAFTLSQAGMVVHWKKAGGKGSGRNMFLNGLGAVATGITVVVVLIAKFTDGAWITVLLIPAMIFMMHAVKRHYDRVRKETSLTRSVNVKDLCAPWVVLPINRWSAVTERGLRFAWSLSPDIRVVHVYCGKESDELRQRWPSLVEAPAKEAELPVPELVILESPFRFVVAPIVNYVLSLENELPDRQFAVLIPELVERRWYFYLLHNNRSQALKAMLLFRGNHRVTVINVPWYLDEP